MKNKTKPPQKTTIKAKLLRLVTNETAHDKKNSHTNDAFGVCLLKNVSPS